jgi:DNA-directed RNA polymerase subunit beta
LGIPADKVTPEVMLKASHKLLNIFKNAEEIDDRNSIAFKTYHSGTDFLRENLGFAAKELKRKIAFKLDHAGHDPVISKVVPPSMFTDHIRSFITTSDVSSIPTQINPMEISDTANRVTLMGEGGIASESAVPDEVRELHPTQFGILDPIRTPESGKVGVDIRATISAFRDDAGNLYTVVLNRKTGKLEHISAAELYKHAVAFPKKDFPKSGKVDVLHKGVIYSKPVSEVEFIIPHSNFLYSTATNLVPFPESSQGNRLIMGSKMVSQALPLKEREQPLVQVASWRKGRTMEGELGEQATPNSPVKGKITKIDKDFIYIAPSHVKHGAEGKKEELVKVPYYTDFPLASKTYLHHDLIVKEGDHVEENQQLGESNFTKDGKLALGKNMNVAFMAYNGLNSNDGIVISEGAAKKLTSLGMYKHVFEADANTRAGKNSHKAYFGNKYTADNYDSLDDDGVIKKGKIIQPGDPLLVSLSKKEPSPQEAMLGKLSKSLLKPYRDASLTWDGEFPAKIIDVKKDPKRTMITVSTEEPMLLGDKLSGRFGNKGVISAIIPDDRMPRDAKGNPIDVLLTSAGVISRINPAQVIEMAVAKAAQAKGKPIAVESFSGKDNVEYAKRLLREQGLSDKETIYDPVTDKKIPGINVGPMYMFKLFKTTKSNYSAHGIGPGYDVNEQPLRGGEEGSKGLGRMEVSCLLAHNARNILKENAVLRSQKNDDFWQRYRLGLPLPQLKSSFAYNKFIAMLQGAGIKVNKTDDNLLLSPMTDNDVNELSSGKITTQDFVRAKDLKPEEGGFFDPNTTGGLSGTKWSHIQLSEPILNPVFHDSARRFLGLTSGGMDAMLKEHGAKHVEKLLSDIDLSSRSRSLKLQLPGLKGTKFDDAVKQLKYINALKENNLTPDKAYIMRKIPVIPPIMRPILPGHGGRMQISDANSLYRDVFLANDALVASKDLTDKDKENAREHLDHSVAALFGLREPVSPQNASRGVKGFLSLIAGQGSPKYGFFQSKIIKKNLDLSGRATVAPDNQLGMDELGVPEQMLWGMMEPFISRRLIRGGRTALEAKKMIEDQHPAARNALIAETKERPVLFNRAPSLHKYNIIGNWAIPISGKTVRVPSGWADAGMSMDYDGDAVSLHVPVTPAAVEEAKRMTTSNLILHNRTKGLMVQPSHEAVIGVYKATCEHESGKRTTKFKNLEDAKASYARGTTQLGDPVEVG